MDLGRTQRKVCELLNATTFGLRTKTIARELDMTVNAIEKSLNRLQEREIVKKNLKEKWILTPLAKDAFNATK